MGKDIAQREDGTTPHRRAQGSCAEPGTPCVRRRVHQWGGSGSLFGGPTERGEHATTCCIQGTVGERRPYNSPTRAGISHMAANLVTNVRNALQGLPEPTIYGWLDSTIALHWLSGNGKYKQFVANRVSKIKQHKEIKWRHVLTLDNPADLASRGESLSETPLWWNGPGWLNNPDQLPDDLVPQSSAASEVEAKVIREVLCVAHTANLPNTYDQLLQKHNLHRTLRIGAWIARFTYNCKSREKRRGPLITEELNPVRSWWIKQVQRSGDIEKDREQLNLQENNEGILVCRDRIQGEFPIYLPDTHQCTEKLVEEAHWRTLHGGVGMTMAHVRQKYWVPKLRRLAKRRIKSCYGCRKFQAIAVAKQPPGNLPQDRTKGDHAFQVVGVDYAGPLSYRTKKGKTAKGYIVLYACSLTRALHLELTTTLETEEFLGTLKRFIARRGRPDKIYSDNGRTFLGAARWVHTVMADEKLQDFLANKEIKWQFNLSRAPWWGGQFERMVGLVKTSLYKTIGQGCLIWTELGDVLLNVEITLNNRPLSYVEDDPQFQILTPHSLMFTSSNNLPEMAAHHVRDKDLRKRAKFLKRSKDVVWRRWTNEYVRGLRERHIQYHGKPLSLAVGDVVVIKSDERNRGEWPLGIITEFFEGKDGVIRAARLRAGKSYMERPIQHLYPMELNCDMKEAKEQQPSTLDANAPQFRPRRKAAAAAAQCIQQKAEEE